MPYVDPSTGFAKATQPEIVAAIKADLAALVSPDLDTSDETPLGQLIQIFADRLAETWEMGEKAYYAIDPNVAEGFLLDVIGILRGIGRNEATYSFATLMVDVDASTTIPSGTIFAVVGDESNTWVTRPTYTFTTAGTYPITVYATLTGPKAALAGTLTEIVTPVSGLNSATNPADAITGRERESDTAYRQRQKQGLAGSGSSTLSAIRSAVIAVPGVLQCVVDENETDGTVDGILPHSFQVVFWDGDVPAADDDEVAQAILDNKGAGARSVGTDSGIAVDDNGRQRTIQFQRGIQRQIYVEITVKGGIEAQVKTRIADFMNGLLNLGDDVVALVIQSCVLAINGGVAGVTDSTSIAIGFSPTPTLSVTLPIAPQEIARFTTSNINVVII